MEQRVAKQRRTARQEGQAPAAAPFLKWAGGKRALLDQYSPFFPERAATYFEPFVGSGAVFFHLRGRGFAEHYLLSDANHDLINVYRVVQDDIETLIEHLRAHRAAHNEDHYYRVRAQDRNGYDHLAGVDRAARMIYLNRTCYNGLWRVNRQGHFNVPMGKYRNPRIVNEHRLRAASAALRGVRLCAEDFANAVREAHPGDFVYFDPPYVPLSATASFTSYYADDFTIAEQRRLADTFRDLDRRGVQAMLSNSDHPLVWELYAGFRIERVSARRAINRDAGKRGPVSEVLVLNY